MKTRIALFISELFFLKNLIFSKLANQVFSKTFWNLIVSKKIKVRTKPTSIRISEFTSFKIKYKASVVKWRLEEKRVSIEKKKPTPLLIKYYILIDF